MAASIVFAFALGIGVFAGCDRSRCPWRWAESIRLGRLHVKGTCLGFIESKVALAVFSLIALGELVADLLPKTSK